MTAAVLNITFDCATPTGWRDSGATSPGCPIDADNRPGEAEVGIAVPNGPDFVFERVPEPKTVKNRVHVCLQPDSARDGEVSALLQMGATLVTDHRQPDGTGWAVLADPESNEFCVLRSAAERLATSG